jgi:cytochrome c1
MSAAELDRWLADPQALRPGTAMPNLALPDSTRNELVSWLVSLR